MRPGRGARLLPIAALLLAGLAGCISDPSEPGADADPPREVGAPTPCGEGSIDIVLGVDSPFSPRPDHAFPIDQGLQGGHHLDISLRAQGALDPDHVDIQMDLIDGDTRIARHLTTDWLLHIDPDGPWCDYPRARLVLVDREGGLLPPEQVDALVGRTLRLDVYLRSPLGDADASFTIVPAEVRRLR